MNVLVSGEETTYAQAPPTSRCNGHSGMPGIVVFVHLRGLNMCTYKCVGCAWVGSQSRPSMIGCCQ